MGFKILMLGWELPPFNSGGLGVACYSLAKSLADKGADITFVLPKKIDLDVDFMKLVFANVEPEAADMQGVYTTHTVWEEKIKSMGANPFDFGAGALLFAKEMKNIIERIDSDVDLIHAHDWLTFPAGIEAKQILKKPFIAHIHATEYDRTGGHYPNDFVYQVEKSGIDTADKVISVSNFTKNTLVEKYGADEEKINVVHNGVERTEKRELPPALDSLKSMGYKIVLFLGRITLQKGPEYFVQAAKRASEFDKKCIFVVTGTGDMQDAMMSESARLGLTDKMLFTGFLRGDELDRIFQSADLYVMPSVSEPFGITPLESVMNGTPVLISKQSGVSEVLKNALRCDFWDVDEMTNKIISVLKYPQLGNVLIEESHKELPNITWDKSANKCFGVYSQLIKAK